jgi:hypothetical protein
MIDTPEPSDYCAPVFIASEFFGTTIFSEEKIAPKKIGSDSIRNGTLTFVEHEGSFYALTCHHVLEELEKTQNNWQKEQVEKYSFSPPLNGFELFTPIGNKQYHFNYKLKPVPKNDDGTQPDIAMAKIDRSFIEKLGRRPLPLIEDQTQSSQMAIACGYAEEQRCLRKGKNLDTLAPKLVTCIATLQMTGNGDLLLQDSIEKHNEVDVLSGMSGGPIMCSNNYGYDLAGIVKEGFDIQSKENQLVEGNNIRIFGEKIGLKEFNIWTKSDLPPIIWSKSK